MWEEQLPIVNPNPEVLLPQRILPLSMGILFFINNNLLSLDPGLLDSEEPEMILGAISKNQLAPLLEDKQWFYLTNCFVFTLLGVIVPSM